MRENALPKEPARVFAEPWHASVFALTVQLSRAGHFSWTEWSERFGAQLRRAAAADGSTDDGRPMPEVDSPTYYDVWLETLESMLLHRGLASTDDLAKLKEAWTEAYLHTPHGQPVVLGVHHEADARAGDGHHAENHGDDHAPVGS
jgi:nitrile hydratase accessory protein